MNTKAFARRAVAPGLLVLFTGTGAPATAGERHDTEVVEPSPFETAKLLEDRGFLDAHVAYRVIFPGGSEDPEEVVVVGYSTASAADPNSMIAAIVWTEEIYRFDALRIEPAGAPATVFTYDNLARVLGERPSEADRHSLVEYLIGKGFQELAKDINDEFDEPLFGVHDRALRAATFALFIIATIVSVLTVCTLGVMALRKSPDAC